VGLSEEDANALLKSANLRSGIYRSYNASIPVGTIMAQEPAANAYAPYDSIVQYVVSQGAGTTSVNVPNVAGKTRKEAEAQLKALGLKAQVRQVPSASVAKNVVISQMPPPGSKAASGGVVGVLVSRGNVSTGPVPDLVGKSSVEASEAIKAKGFTPVVVEISTAAYPAGQVFGQYPAANVAWPLRFPVIVAVAKQ